MIKHTSQFAKMRFGRVDKKPDDALNAFVDAGKAAKIDIESSKKIERERWEKFIFLTAMAGSTAARARRSGPIVADPECAALFRALMEEARRGRQAPRASKLAAAFLDQRMEFAVKAVEPGMKASMAHDLERGNRLELDWLNGKVRALGRNSASRRRPTNRLYRAQTTPHGGAYPSQTKCNGGSTDPIET